MLSMTVPDMNGLKMPLVTAPVACTVVVLARPCVRQFVAKTPTEEIRMDTITHALAPVILTRLVLGKPAWMPKYGLVFIGLAGALPDLLNPHITLESRLASWSHGLPFWTGLSTVLLVTALARPRLLHVKLAALLSAAYLFHMACDAISGGINWLHPFGTFVWGAYLVNPLWWIPMDVILILTAYYLFRLQPLRARLKNAVRRPDT
ncbi:MAG: metal-dependent hydrolase [Verrucomicrobiaceae bacterium]|nr:MAG: metal-dependent hydrolase [Verrucomicrobiaceae bacterium]